MVKKNFKVAALSLLLVGMATSCQKDGEMGPSQELSQKSLAQETSILFFKIDGEKHYRKFDSQEEREDFIRHLIHLTREGHIIIIESNEKPNYAPDDRREFESKDEEEIDKWAKEMYDKGYNVEVDFDEERGIFKGTAIPKETRTTTVVSTGREDN
ncbi:MAG: hypothetical protein J6V33_03630 [Bacteroidales bacterium]|nr:hypothetical protein [Bacteroidales bacterium]